MRAEPELRWPRPQLPTLAADEGLGKTKTENSKSIEVLGLSCNIFPNFVPRWQLLILARVLLRTASRYRRER